MFGSVLLLSLASSSLGQLCSSAGWTDSDRNGIINTHNTLRSQLANGTYLAKGVTKLSAKDMTKVAYDCSLETSAQSWANGCPAGHSGAAGKGENMYWTYSTAPISVAGQGAAASQSWANEFQQYGFSTANNNNLTLTLFNSGIGHATQMAWSSSNKVGCGVKSCPSNYPSFKYMLLVVCQYTPQGNILNRNVYNTGTACSACPSGTTCETATKLCK